MRFEFATAAKIIFGGGCANEIPVIASQLGKSAFIITDERIDYTKKLITNLQAANIHCSVDFVHSEPTTHSAMKSVAKARKAGCDIVLGLGGGSVIDTGKVIAAMLTNTGEIMDYLEVVGKGQPLKTTPAPYIAIPTTAGTGAEVTRNAVLAVPEHNVKVSMRSPLMLPKVALVDPELTWSMPAAVTASTGLDALTQLLEAYVSIKANPLTDGICLQGLKRAARSLKKAYQNGSDAQAREDMSLASLFGGLALANAKLGAVHGFAGPLGGMIHAPHGAICASLLPYVVRMNVKALTERAPQSQALERFNETAQILTGNTSADSLDAVAWIADLCKQLNVPGLSELGLSKDDFEAAVEKAQKASSMKGNPITLKPEELLKILEQAY